MQAELRDRGVGPWVGMIPLEKDWQPTPVFLPGASHGQRSLVGYSPWGRRVGSVLGGSKTALSGSLEL